MFYIARGLAAWIVAGQQLTGFPEELQSDRPQDRATSSPIYGLPPPGGLLGALADVVSVQTLWMVLVAVVAGIVLAYTPFGQKVYATGGNRRAADYAGINTNRVRFIALVFSALCATMAGIIYIAYLPQLQSDRRPVPRARRHRLGDHRRRLDLRRLRHDHRLARRRGGDHAHPRACCSSTSQGFVMPQHWVNVFIGVILIVAVLIDIWVRQANILGAGPRASPERAPGPKREAPVPETVDPPTPIVEMRGIDKTFGAVRALVDVNLTLYPGEILGLVGDNSAGKSTLMKILTGAYQRDAGEILVDGEPVHFKSPHESRDVGIEMIYQDFALCGNMDVGQNIFLGRWPRRGLFVDRQKMYAEADRVLKRLKVDVNSVYQRVESLSGGRQQSVAIARAISFEPRVVILDEPTANLSVMATERLLETMLELKKHGVAQIIISHRLHDIFEVGDRVMVLKRGENVGDRSSRTPTEHEVLGLIVSGTRASATTARQTADNDLRRIVQ